MVSGRYALQIHLVAYNELSSCVNEQHSQKCEQVRLLQQTLDEKRSELLRAESKLRETEEKLYTIGSVGISSDKVKDDLRVCNCRHPSLPLADFLPVKHFYIVFWR